MKETELFYPVKEYLIENGYSDVYGEVCLMDMVGLSESSEVIVELKLTLNFHLIEQAYAARRYAEKVYIAVPKLKTSLTAHRFARKICSDYGIGVLYVDMKRKKVVKVYEPKEPNRKYQKGLSIRRNVKEAHKEFVGGSRSGDSETLYTVTMREIKNYLADKEWVSAQEIAENVTTHYAKPIASIRATLQEPWNQDWCESRIHRGKRTFRLKKEKTLPSKKKG